MAKVVFKAPNGKLCEVVLKQRNTLGRHPAQDIQILDRVVSKAHAIIEAHGADYYIYDIGSRNGTVVNGQRLTGRHLLKPGDEITLGSTSVRFVDEAEEAAPAERVTIHADSRDGAAPIRRRLESNDDSGKFLPESEIDDPGILRRDYEKLRVALELNQEVGLQFDLDMLLNKVLDKAFEIFAADRGVILIKDDAQDGVMVPATVRSRNNADADTANIRISQTILKEVVDEKSAVLSSDAMLDSRFSGSHSIILEGIRSTMSVPLLYDNDVLGVVHLDSQIATGAFTEKDLQLLSVFARQAAMHISHHKLLKEMESNILARDKFSRLLPPYLVEQVLNGVVEIKKSGDKRIATVIFSDIRGFTSTTERSEAEEVVELLNDYFEVMVDIIFTHEGTLDKFLGDGIMAIWGAPMHRDDHPQKAVDCALDMLDALADFNADRIARNKDPVDVGIGIATGEMIAGYMGSSRALDYTVIGDTVNLGSRLCSAAGPGEILVNQANRDCVVGTVELVALPPVRVKGKAAPVKLYRVLDRIRAADDNPATETHTSVG